MSDVTQILAAIEKGEPKAAEELLPLVYEELRKLAAFKLAQQPANQTLQPTALVHDAYLRLLGNGHHSWQDRRHFFAAAAEAMRHILVDRARRKATPTLNRKTGRTCARVLAMSAMIIQRWWSESTPWSKARMGNCSITFTPA